MYNLMIKSFFKNKKRIIKYIITYLLILLIFSITIIFKNIINYKIDIELNVLENRKIILHNSNLKFEEIEKIIENNNIFQKISYNSVCNINNINITNYYNENDKDYYAKKNIIYIQDETMQFDIKDFYNNSYDLDDFTIYSNNTLSKNLIENNFCSYWNITGYIDSYKDATKILNILKDAGINANYTPINNEEFNTFTKLKYTINTIIILEIFLAFIINLYMIIQFLIEQRKNTILLKAIGYKNKNICIIYILNLVLIILIAFVIYIFIGLFIALIFNNKSIQYMLLNFNYLYYPILFIIPITSLTIIVIILKQNKASINNIKGVF